MLQLRLVRFVQYSISRGDEPFLFDELNYEIRASVHFLAYFKDLTRNFHVHLICTLVCARGVIATLLALIISVLLLLSKLL